MLIDSIGQGTHAGPVHTISGGVLSQITVTPADSTPQPASYEAQQTTLDDVSTQSYGMDCATSSSYPTYTSHIYEVGHYLLPPFPPELRSHVFPQWPAPFTALGMWNLYFLSLVFISENTPVLTGFDSQETSKHSNHNNHYRILRTSMRTSLPPHLQLILSMAIVGFQPNRPTYSLPHPMRDLCLKWPSPHTQSRTVYHIPIVATINPPSIVTLPHPTPQLSPLTTDSKTGRPLATGICRKCSVDIPRWFAASHSPTTGNSSFLVHGTTQSECGTSIPARPFVGHWKATPTASDLSHSLRMTDVLSLALTTVQTASGMYRQANSCASLRSINTESGPQRFRLMEAKSYLAMTQQMSSSRMCTRTAALVSWRSLISRWAEFASPPMIRSL